MSDHISQPRLLLRRLHRVMAGDDRAQVKLDQIVKAIAQNMVAEVCSIYLARAGGIFELFATEGLKEEAVHQTRMQVGEGLVGFVAERGLPLNLSEAPSHPRFSYRPETGEELYHSFLGVPILYGGRVNGILVVQNVAPRRYREEEVEALQTIGMVLAELVGGGALIKMDELSEAASITGEPVTLTGMPMTDGIGIGVAVFHEPRAEVRIKVADDVDEEFVRLEDGIAALRLQLDEMISHPDLAQGGEHREVLETYRMFAYDQGWHSKMQDAVRAGLTAEAGVERVQQENRARMQTIRDPYLRERLGDFDDIANRLIRTIQGGGVFVAHESLQENTILIARSLGPAEIMDYDRTLLKGIALEEGSPTAHVAIIARAMGIPIIGRIPGLIQHIDGGDQVAVDSASSHVLVRPSDDVVESVQHAIDARHKLFAEYAAERDYPAITKDGERFSLLINAGMRADMSMVEQTGAEGVGLYRTEFQFMVSPTLPKVEEQRKVYADVMEAAGKHPVVFRTLDIGGDKTVPFLPRMEEENPAMGWRAIRLALDRPALLRYQLRALLYATVGRDLHVMFPMIADVSEMKAVKALLAAEVLRLTRFDKEGPNSIKVGCMLEIPSLAWQMDMLLKEVDFISIGTNDLMQFFFACDRSNPMLAGRYDLLCPPVLNFLQSTILACHRSNVPVTLCGEMGGRPLEAMALAGIGLTRFSVSPAAIGPVKRMIRSMNLSSLKQFMQESIGFTEHSLRDRINLYAHDHGIILE